MEGNDLNRSGGGAAQDCAADGLNRYQTLLDSIDEGYCIIEMLQDPDGRWNDYLFVETNRVFEQQSGLHDAVGRRARELMPIVDQDWFERYGRVADTGEPIRFVTEAVSLGRWLDICAFRVGSPGDRHVGVLFTDITERKLADVALRASEERYRNLFESIDEGFCLIEMIFDESGKPVDYLFLETNPAFEKQCGLQDALGKRILELRPQHEAYWFESFGQVVRTGERLRFQALSHSLGGRSFDICAVRVGGPDSRKVAIVFTDITERLTTAAAIAASEQRYRRLFEAAHDGILILNADTAMIEDVNPFLIDLLDYPREYFIGKELWEIGVFPDIEHSKAAMRELQDKKSIRFEDMPLEDKQGNKHPVEFVSNVYQENGRRVIQCNIRDISERKMGAEELRHAANRFRFMAESMPQKVFTADASGAMDYFNPQWMEYTGLSFEQIKGRGWKQFIHPLDLQETVRRWHHSIDTGEPFDMEHRFARADGAYRWHMSGAHCMLDVDGNSAMWIGSVTDIEDVKRIERERATLLVNEQASRMEAETANRSKDLFLATLSHELRTPLNAIVGWISILRRKKGSPTFPADLQEGLEVIERNTKAQVQLIEDVLDVSRIVSGKLRLEMRWCDLADAVKAGIDVVRPVAEARDITLDVQLDPAVSKTSCDSARIQQVVWNLLSNAVKFTPKGGTVGVSLSRCQSSIQIQVTDSGQGLHPDLLPFIFDRFRQADSSTRRNFGGLGLGLSIVKHLVEMHGGTVAAHSAGAGKGSTFTVRLPIKAVRAEEDCSEKGESGPAADDQAEDAAAPDSMRTPLVRLDGLRVLVVDDEADARRLVAKVLTQSGATVAAAAGAEEALHLLAGFRPDVLVSDIGMPDMDGFDLIKKVRSLDHAGRKLPAVALTAFAHNEDQRRVLLAGFQVHVAKPVDPHDLLAVVASLAGPQ